MQTTAPGDFDTLLRDVSLLRQDIIDAELQQAAQIAAVRPRHRFSATNVVHYTELRAHDLRDLQGRLAARGLSSLGRTESQVLASVDALIATLAQLAEHEPGPVLTEEARTDGAELLSRNAARLLGPRPKDRATRIMVTLPSEAASDPILVRNMLTSGMEIARINCAHDGPDQWAAMVANVRAAEAATGQGCVISMDLGGPKLRTGPIRPGPEVLKVKPSRDTIGVVQQPAHVWLGTRIDDAPESAVPVVPLDEAGWAGKRHPGEKIRLLDARGSRRILTVEKVDADACLVSTPKTVYFVPGTELFIHENAGTRDGSAHIGPLPASDRSLLVRRGDTLVLTRDLTPVEVSADGVHRIGCTLSEVFADAHTGERVLLDDGKIGGLITGVAEGELIVEVGMAGVNGTKLRAEKGINLPDTQLSLSALTEQDIDDLAFVKRHADIVEVSFVRSVADVQEVLKHLEDVEDHALDVVLKIETVAAFESLPQILLEAMRWENIGVMIARGDLAVEAGFERMAEVQEEILWLCEAAHVPVIWATQVLDTMARTGLPSRAEVTDAAMAERAECVMLNKGPFIDEAITMLAGILTRMQEHTHKKRSLLRRLRAWD